MSFTDFEVNPAGSPKVNDNLLETMEHHFENNAVDESENEKPNILQSISDYEIKDHISVKRSLSFSGLEQQGSEETKPPNHLKHENDELSQLQSANYELGEDVINYKEKELLCLKRKNGDNYSPSDEHPMPEKKPTIAVESNTMDLECSTDNDQSEKELSVPATDSSTDQSLEKKNDISSQTISEGTTREQSLEEGGVFQESNGKTSTEDANSLSKKKTSSMLKSASIGRVLRSRHQSLEMTADIGSQTTSESTTEQQSLEGTIFQEADGKTSEEGASSLSGKKTTARVKLSTFSSELTSVSSSRVLRPRHKTM